MAGPLVVIPTYNEAGNVVAMMRAVIRAVPSASVLIVDDGSPDGTADLADRAAAGCEPGRVHVLRRPAKSGLGSAYVEGFRWGIARGHDVLVQMDADFQHDPAAVPELLAALDRGADMAIGSRYVAGGSLPASWPWTRKGLSRLANWYARTMLRLPVQDVTAGFRAHRTPSLERLDLDAIRADGYGFQIELTHRARLAGARIVEVPIRFGERVEGESKMSARIILEALRLVTSWAARRR